MTFSFSFVDFKVGCTYFGFGRDKAERLGSSDLSRLPPDISYLCVPIRILEDAYIVL